jgi:hypothetical protein
MYYEISIGGFLAVVLNSVIVLAVVVQWLVNRRN